MHPNFVKWYWGLNFQMNNIMCKPNAWPLVFGFKKEIERLEDFEMGRWQIHKWEFIVRSIFTNEKWRRLVHVETKAVHRWITSNNFHHDLNLEKSHHLLSCDFFMTSNGGYIKVTKVLEEGILFIYLFCPS
jgi:hypothetical protein